MKDIGTIPEDDAAELERIAIQSEEPRESFIDFAPPPEDAPAIEWKMWDMGTVEEWETEPLRWGVEGLIPAGGIGFLSGAPKDGKSLLMCDLVVHIAHGKPWLGRFNTTSSRILYIAREDPARRLKERITEINKSYGYGPLPVGCVDFVIRDRFLLTDSRHIDWLYEQTKVRRYDFIILDVLNRMIPDLDEMQAKDMAKMVSILERLNRDLNLTILCIDHTRKPSTGRGSGRDEQKPNPFDLKGSIAKYGAADFMLCVARTQQPGRIQFYAENKDSDDHPHFLIDVSPKGSSKPKFQHAGDVEKLSNDMKAIGDANRGRVLAIFKTRHDRLSSSAIAETVDLSEATVRRHLARLVRDGDLDTIGEGRAKRYWLKSDQEGA